MPASPLNIPGAQPLEAARLAGARQGGAPSALGPSNAEHAGQAERSRARAFAEQLGKFQRETDAEGDPARNTAKELIAQGLVLPMLKMSRESAFKTGMFHGGQGEKAFGAQLDQRLARRVAEDVAPGLVEAVYQQVQGFYTEQTEAGGDAAKGKPGLTPGAVPGSSPVSPNTLSPAAGKEVDRHG